MKKALATVAVVAAVTGGLVAFAESRGSPYTPAELLKQSTLVFKGVVIEFETVDEYKVSFPTKASVVEVLKGKWADKDIGFRHKNPGRSVIFEKEFNKPERGQKGTFYLEEQNGTFVLIGYIREE